jgi:hypothetical protein
MTDAENQQLIKDISPLFVMQIAPEELLELYFENAVVATPSDDPLAFGSELIVAVTPFIAIAVQVVIQFLSEDVLDALKKEGTGLIIEKIRLIFSPKVVDKQGLPTLTKQQLATMHQLIYKEVTRHGMNTKQAEDVALMITARLAINA